MWSGERRKRVWRRARPTGVAPVGLIVALAVVCIIFAVLSSAHRADVVAQQHERQLFTHALSERQAQIVSEVEYISSFKEAYQRLWIQLDEQWVQQQIGLRLKNQLDHTLVLLVDPATDFVHRLAGQANVAPDLSGLRTLSELGSILGDLFATAPALAHAPAAGLRGTHPRAARSVTRLQRFLDQPAMLAAAVLPNPESRSPTTAMPVLLVVSLLVEPFLDQVGARLELPRLRPIAAIESVETDNTFMLSGSDGSAVAHFAWRPNRPGASILVDSHSKCNISEKASAGVRKSRHFLGVLL